MKKSVALIASTFVLVLSVTSVQASQFTNENKTLNMKQIRTLSSVSKMTHSLKKTINETFGPEAPEQLTSMASVEKQEPTLAVKPTIPSTPYNSSGRFIIVNKSAFTLTLFNDGQIEKKYTCTIGKHAGDTETPEGKFKIISKRVNPYYYEQQIPGGDSRNPLGVRWLGMNVGITIPNSIGIHGTNDPGSVGSAASTGCIRLVNDDVVDLYNRVSIDTPVWVGDQNELSSWGIKS